MENWICGELDPEIIFGLLEDFDPVKIEYMYLDREHGLTIVDRGNK